MLGSKKYIPILNPEEELPMCSKCIYAFPEKITQENPTGYTCWRYPPKDHVINGKVVTYAPATRSAHSCGEGRWFVKGWWKPLDYDEISALIFKREEK